MNVTALLQYEWTKLIMFFLNCIWQFNSSSGDTISGNCVGCNTPIIQGVIQKHLKNYTIPPPKVYNVDQVVLHMHRPQLQIKMSFCSYKFVNNSSCLKLNHFCLCLIYLCTFEGENTLFVYISRLAFIYWKDISKTNTINYFLSSWEMCRPTKRFSVLTKRSKSIFHEEHSQ